MIKLNRMYKFDEQALRRGINMGLGSQGIWTPELENVMFDEITNEALRIHDVVGRSEQLKACDHVFVDVYDHTGTQIVGKKRINNCSF